MESLNKVLTVVLGLIVVMILLAVLTSRLKINRSNLFSFNTATTITPVPTGRANIITPTKAPRKGFFSFLNRPTPTKNPEGVVSPTPTDTNDGVVFFNKGAALTVTPNKTQAPKSQAGNVQRIPKTGPELFLPFTLAALSAGMYLRKQK